MKKYNYTGESKQIDGHWVHRIVALKDFECNGHKVSKGSYGGWIEKMENLAQEGTCWVFDDAVVMDNARVVGNARICNASVICGNACVCGYAQVLGDSEVNGFANVVYHAVVLESYVFEYASVGGWANIERTTVRGHGIVSGEAVVRRSVCSGYGKITGCSYVDRSNIGGGALVYGQAKIVRSDIEHTSDYIVFNNNWSSVRYFTYVFSTRMWTVGCFYGSSEELLKKAARDSPEKAKKYALFVSLVNAMENLDKGRPALCIDRI